VNGAVNGKAEGTTDGGDAQRPARHTTRRRVWPKARWGMAASTAEGSYSSSVWWRMVAACGGGWLQ
jgi:hypothetical protein